MTTKRKRRIGLALGSGSARGWAHIGVIRALKEAGIEPDVVCGSSVGALVGAIYVHGDLDGFEEWVRALNWKRVVSLLDFTLEGGLIQGERLMAFLAGHLQGVAIEQLAKPFAAVATDLETGNEVWLQEGSVVEAVRASVALPGLFSPARVAGRLLVDGGLVNPVPVTLARALGADFVIGVDLNSDLIGRHLPARSVRRALAESRPEGAEASWLEHLKRTLGLGRDEAEGLPSLLDVVASSINIMQVRVTRSRLAGEPADLLVTPRLARVGLMDYDRGKAAITEGQRAAERALMRLKEAEALG
ncbi:MAG TPA: patatin-like phospholipase family protein [Pelomicrobium sp.]|nr:patatin-like phospholipase family protein [Pelomicrobium sp.]